MEFPLDESWSYGKFMDLWLGSIIWDYGTGLLASLGELYFVFVEIVGVVFWKGFAYNAQFLTVLEGSLTLGLSTVAKVYRDFGIR